jgi:guanine deaminase
MNSDGALLGIRGHLIDTPERGKVRSVRDGAIVIESGLIAEVGDYDALSRKPRKQELRWLHSSHVAVFPGLIDLHTHLPQYPVVAKGHLPLLPWLRDHIFPTERDFTAARAAKESAMFFRTLAHHGTTTAMCYCTSSEAATEAVFQEAEKSGQRLILGAMMMDVDVGQGIELSPLANTLAASDRLCRKWNGAAKGLIRYAFSPRFAVCCTEDLMRGAADLAGRHGAFIQTHLSENREELEKVREIFPRAKDYTDVYHQCGLLTERTMLGHCIHLSDREIGVLSETGSNAAHCPTANLFLQSGIMPLEQLERRGVRIGLGSDVAAGPELDLWRVMRTTVEVQRARSFFCEETSPPLPVDAFYMATRGAAEALRMAETIGTLDVGMEADLTVVDCSSLVPFRKGTKALFDLSAEDIISLCVYRGGPHATIETFVRGRSVYRASEPRLF